MEVFKSLSSVKFSSVAASPSLTHLTVAAHDSPYLLLVNIADYFHIFPNHYSKKYSSSTPRSRRKHHTRSAAATRNKILLEEEEDRLLYGGLTRKHLALGQNYIGSYAGQVAWQSRNGHLKSAVRNVDPSRGRGYGCPGSLKLSVDASTSRTMYHSKERKWYEPPQHQPSSLMNCYEAPCVATAFKKAGALSSSTVALSPSSSLSLPPNGFLYSSPSVLPSPDSHVTQSYDTLLHIDCGSDIVVAYYGSKNGSQTSGTGVTSQLPHGKVSVIGVYYMKHQTCSVTQ